MEIERKFLIHQLPGDLDSFPRRRIQQAYLSTDPVLRVRRSDEACWLTYKGPGLMVREEHEFPLKSESCDRLMAKAEGQVISKDRYHIHWGEHTIELDIFHPPFAPLMMAEVEFASEEEALAFQPPEWFGREVTEDPAYTNASLSQHYSEADAVRPGRYRHFKGNEYQVLYVAKHSETQEPMVVYRALYGEGGVWVRPASMWNETVTRDGQTFRRFTYVGED